MKTMQMAVEVLVVLALMAFGGLAVGCVGPQGSASGDGVSIKNSTHNIARQDDDSWETAIAGPFPTNVIIDDEGANVQTGGPNTVLGFTIVDNEPRVFTSNPADTKFERLVYDRDEGILTIDGFESSKSNVITAYNQQVIAWAQTQGVITQEQAAVASKLVEGGMGAFDAILTVLGGV